MYQVHRSSISEHTARVRSKNAHTPTHTRDAKMLSIARLRRTLVAPYMPEKGVGMKPATLEVKTMQPFFLALTNFEEKWCEMFTAAVALPFRNKRNEENC